MLISVDPGVQGSGVCWWSGGRLVRAEYRQAPVPFEAGTVVVVEQMRVYPGARFAADLLDVSFAGGVVCAHYYPNVEKVAASEWKKQVPKKIHHERLRAGATSVEIQILDGCGAPKSLLHNVWDAFGIGLWWLKKEGVR